MFTVYSPAADYISYIVTEPGNPESSENMITVEANRVQIPITFHTEGDYLIHAWAGSQESAAAYAEQTATVSAYHALRLNPYRVSVSTLGETAEVKVSCDSDWSLESDSSWFTAEKTSAGIRITVTDEQCAGKTGYVTVACGKTEARLAVYGPDESGL